MTKVISLSDEAYGALKSLKKEGESFSEIVNRIASSAEKRDILEFWGKWPGGNKELDRIEQNIYERRKNFKIRAVEF